MMFVSYKYFIVLSFLTSVPLFPQLIIKQYHPAYQPNSHTNASQTISFESIIWSLLHYIDIKLVMLLHQLLAFFLYGTPDLFSRYFFIILVLVLHVFE